MAQACDYVHLRCPLTSVNPPMKSQVTRASSEAPYLCAKLRVDPQRIVEPATLLPLSEPGAVSVGEGIVWARGRRQFSMQRYSSCDCSILRATSLFSRRLSRLRRSLRCSRDPAAFRATHTDDYAAPQLWLWAGDCAAARTLQRRRTAVLGKPPVAFFQDLRIERAQSLLHGSGLALEAIAAEVGYNDGGTLRTLLRERLGRGVRDLRADLK